MREFDKGNACRITCGEADLRELMVVAPTATTIALPHERMVKTCAPPIGDSVFEIRFQILEVLRLFDVLCKIRVETDEDKCSRLGICALVWPCVE